MKKVFLFIVCFGLLNMSSFSQIIIGLSTNYSICSSDNLLGMSLKGGYSFANKLEVSIDYDYSVRFPAKLLNQSFSAIGINSVYLFGKKQIKPFAGCKVSYAQAKILDDMPFGGEFPKDKGILIAPKIGINIKSVDNFSFDFGASYDYYNFDNAITFFTYSFTAKYAFNI